MRQKRPERPTALPPSYPCATWTHTRKYVKLLTNFNLSWLPSDTLRGQQFIGWPWRLDGARWPCCSRTATVRQTSGLAVSYLHCPIIQLPHQSRPAHAGPPRKAGCHLWLLKMRVSVRLAGVYREVLNILWKVDFRNMWQKVSNN